MKSQKFKISYYLDTRSQKSNGTYPLKLNVYSTFDQKNQLFKTKFSFAHHKSETEKMKADLLYFDEIINYTSPITTKRLSQRETKIKNIKRELEDYLSDISERAEKLAIENPSLEDFKKLFSPDTRNELNVEKLYKTEIELYRKRGKINTELNYEYSLRSLQSFRESQKINRDFLLREITPVWLQEYEDFMVSLKMSYTTIGIYLRPLRAIFNNAISNKVIEASLYPFHRNDVPKGYVIPKPQRVIKSLSKEEIDAFFEVEPKNQYQEKAKDFFFFSYLSNGMNIKDIAQLRFSDIKKDRFAFKRAKTIHTSKDNLKTITVFISDFQQMVFDKYALEKKKNDDFVFDIITKTMNPVEQRNAINKFVRFINQHMKNLAKAYNLNEEISTYYARHTFATVSINSNVPLNIVGDLMGHQTTQTTRGYYGYVPNEVLKNIQSNLLTSKRNKDE